MSPLRVHSEAEADVVFIPIYADIGCRLAQEKASDLAAWRSAVDRCAPGPIVQLAAGPCRTPGHHL
jgi:hypothetical protein